MTNQTSPNFTEILKAYDARNAAEIAEANQKAARAKEVAAIMEKQNNLAKAHQERNKREPLPYRLAILLATPLTKEDVEYKITLCGNDPELLADALARNRNEIIWRAEEEAAALRAAEDLAAEEEEALEEAADAERRARQEEEEEYFYKFGKRMPTDHDDARQTYNDNIASGLNGFKLF